MSGSESGSDNREDVEELFSENLDRLVYDEAEEGEILDDIIQESTPVVYGPPLKGKVNTLIEALIGTHKVLKDTPDKLRNTLIPQGTECLNKTMVNEPVYPLLGGS